MTESASRGVNRRRFIAPDGRIIEAPFDVYWFAVDADGRGYIFSAAPDRYSHAWLVDNGSFMGVYHYTGCFNWKVSRWRLDDSGKWKRC